MKIFIILLFVSGSIFGKVNSISRTVLPKLVITGPDAIILEDTVWDDIRFPVASLALGGIKDPGRNYLPSNISSTAFSSLNGGAMIGTSALGSG